MTKSSQRKVRRRSDTDRPRFTADPGRETDDGQGGYLTCRFPDGKAAHSCGHSAGLTPASPFAARITRPDPDPGAWVACQGVACQAGGVVGSGQSCVGGPSAFNSLRTLHLYLKLAATVRGSVHQGFSISFALFGLLFKLSTWVMRSLKLTTALALG